MRPASTTVIAALTVGAAYLAGLATLAGSDGDALIEALFLLASLGLLFPLLVWALTRRQAVQRPPAAAIGAGKLAGLLGYLALFAVLMLGWGFSALHGAGLSPRADEFATVALKLITMVALPLLLFGRPWAPPSDDRGDRRRNLVAFVVMALALSGFQALFGRGLQTLGELDPAAATLAWAIPGCFLWQTLEAGLCEEVLFRRVLQERLAGWLGAQGAAILWASLLFGLAHAPGLLLRGQHAMEGAASTSLAWALAYSVVIIAPVGVLFGVLWARTRSLWLVVPLHGAVDLLPQLAPFIKTWAGLPG